MSDFESFFQALKPEDRICLLKSHENKLKEKIESIKSSLKQVERELYNVLEIQEKEKQVNGNTLRPKSIRETLKEKVNLYLSKELRELLADKKYAGKSYAHLIRSSLGDFYEGSEGLLSKYLESYCEQEKSFNTKDRQTFVTNISTDLLSKIDQSAHEFDTDRRHIIESILWATLNIN